MALVSDSDYMQQALLLAHEAQANGEVPVGALVVMDDAVIATGYNSPISLHDPTAHAEVVALRSAAQHQGNYRLPGSTLFVTLEPCLMCLGAILHARVARVVFGAYDPRAGMISSVIPYQTLNRLQHKIHCEGGVLQAECSALLKSFFADKRR